MQKTKFFLFFKACLNKWDKIPDDTDILITHTPPVGYGDLCCTGVRAGCVELLNTVRLRVRPKYHIYGHIHEGYGVRYVKNWIFWLVYCWKHDRLGTTIQKFFWIFSNIKISTLIAVDGLKFPVELEGWFLHWLPNLILIPKMENLVWLKSDFAPWKGHLWTDLADILTGGHFPDSIFLMFGISIKC